MTTLPLLIDDPEATAGYHLEAISNGVRIDPADAIKTGFIVPPQSALAVLALINAGLARTPRTTLYASRLEQVASEGIR